MAKPHAAKEAEVTARAFLEVEVTEVETRAIMEEASCPRKIANIALAGQTWDLAVHSPK